MRAIFCSTFLLSLLALVPAALAAPSDLDLIERADAPAHKPCFKRFSQMKLGIINVKTKYIRHAGGASHIPVSIEPEQGEFTGIVSDDHMPSSHWDFYQCEYDWTGFNNSKTISVGQFRPSYENNKKRITLFESYYDNVAEWLKLDFRSGYYSDRRRAGPHSDPHAFTWILHIGYHGKVHAAEFALWSTDPKLSRGYYHLELAKKGEYPLWGDHRPIMVHYLDKSAPIANDTTVYMLSLSP